MTQLLPTPGVPILAKIKGMTVEEMVIWLTDYYNQNSVGFNYVRGTRIIKSAHRGFHNIDHLILGCDAEKTKVGRSANRDLVKSVAPFCFGRKTQVFDLPARRFSFGRRSSGFRVPFFFVEDSTIKLYYLQPTKSVGLSYDELCMVATIHKRYLLDTEFFGEKSDLEILEASAPAGEKVRNVQKFCLNDINLWSEERLSNQLTMISQALDIVESSTDVKPRRRRTPKVLADMPLFS